MRRSVAATAALALPAVLLAASAGSGGMSASADVDPTWTHVGTYTTGLGAASGEIASFNGDRLYVINTEDNSLDVVDASDPSDPQLVRRVRLDAYGAGPNSVAAQDGLVAVAVQADDKTDPGRVVFLNPAGKVLGTAQVGALPDMVTFTPDGRRVVVANEGEPSGYLADSVDPAGTVSVIDVRPGSVKKATARTANFGDFERDELDGVRLNGPGASVQQDLEPEYVAVSRDSRTAWVTLQENNAIATVDLGTATVTKVMPLGWKDHSVAGQGLDASEEDGDINIAQWPLRGLFMPDAVAASTIAGQQVLVTANEGDGREYDGFEDEAEVEDVTLAGTFGDSDAIEELQEDENLGSINISATDGLNAMGEHEALYSFGSRSFTIWDAASGARLYDSGDEFEQIVAASEPDHFNADHEDNEFDSRSDNKGPEPEGVATGVVDGRTYAFVGLERIGGFMVYDISDPSDASFVQWVNNRDFTLVDEEGEDAVGPDSGAEGVSFVPASASPTGEPLVVVSNEITGTVSFFSPLG
jgi:2',3'-cyclic-nucleotide 2'-phosphodiesterase/3'-nucleotidase/5'-nucleotidase